MRQILAALVLAAFTQVAVAQQSSVKTDPADKPDLNGPAAMEQAAHKQAIIKVMQDAGLKEVQLSDTVLVQAKDRQDKPVMLLVDPKSMTAIQLQVTPSDNETTGSGSIPDGAPARKK